MFFDPETTDFAPVMTNLLSSNPAILCLDTSYADYVHPLCEQAYQQGFKGKIISCTADFYEQIIEKTSKEFMEGFIFQFPDFDDPALNEPADQLRVSERVLHRVQPALARRVERGVVGVRFDHGPLGTGRPACRKRPSPRTCWPA